MKRTSRIFLNSVNKGKKERVILFLEKYAEVVRYFIEMLWSKQEFTNRINYEDVKKGIERFKIGSYFVLYAYEQAKAIVNSQSKKSRRKRKMPKFKNITANLGYQFFKLSKFEGSFDWALKFYTKFKRGENIIIPFNNTKHTLKFLNDGWEISNTIRLGYIKKNGEKKVFIDLIFRKPKPKIPKIIKDEIEDEEVLGIDFGYRYPIATSRKELIGGELKEKIEKIDKRRKGFHHYVLTEYNRLLKSLNLDGIKLIAIENLKNVKKNKRGKFPRRTNRLLSYWLYARAINKLKQICEEQGICVKFKSPWKTSQTCPYCGKCDNRNRNRDRFCCINCGFEEHADIVGAMNLKRLGLADAHSLRSLQNLQSNYELLCG